MSAVARTALARDIDLLGGILGSTIRRLAGSPSFLLVEEVREASRALREAPSVDAARALRDRLGRLDLAQLRTLVRAFSVYFDLVNLAEQQARVRALRKRAAEERAADPQSETAEAALLQIRSRGVGRDEVAEHLADALVVPIFTAHPSEARRRTTLERLAAIAHELDRLEYGHLIPAEQATAMATIAEHVEGLWLTNAVRVNRPTVLDEVRQLLGLVEGRLLDVVPRVYRKLEGGLGRVYPDRRWRPPPFLQFGSWIGGDRDGHPSVTHDVTAAAVRLQQEAILRQYLSRVEDLGRRLSHSLDFFSPGPAFRESLDADAKLFPALAVGAHEPYRAKCRYIGAKLAATLETVLVGRADWGRASVARPATNYGGPVELIADLRVLQDDLRRAGGAAAADGVLQDLIQLVEVFGLHLLKLDVRQHSARHAAAVAEAFRSAGVCPDYLGLTPDERFALLAAELEARRPLIPAHLTFTPESTEVIQTFRTLAAIAEQQCPGALGPYIISSTTEPAHLLEVLLLAREARAVRPADGVSRIDIIPLFEALEPLRGARKIMARVFAVPAYRRQLELRGNLQEVMIGYSDSNKESGFLQSAWALYRVQHDVSRLGRAGGIKVRFCHGRGGAVGRGGGPANHAILAQPPGTVAGRLRMTEQGEMMADRYGHPAIAERHLEQVLNAVLRTSFPGDEDQPEPAWVEALDGLAESARRHYRALVYDDPEFLAYFEQATCIGEIGRLKIGSRPARRAQTNGIDQLRAIPWVFSWMQSRHTLPGWYGLGGAIQEFLASRPDGMPMLRDMYGRWPFWTTLIDNAQMILAKADLTIARLYADLVEDQALAARVFDRIATEYRLAADAVCRVTGQGSLLERSPILKTSIERRNPYVDPLSFIQLVLLKRLRAGGEGTTGLETAVLESINGIASGLKNTG